MIFYVLLQDGGQKYEKSLLVPEVEMDTPRSDLMASLQCTGVGGQDMSIGIEGTYFYGSRGMTFSVTFQIVAKLARVSKSIGKISLAEFSRLPRTTCYLRHLLIMNFFEQLQT